MTKSAKHFDEFEPHTRLKQLVLETYLKAWARKLLLRPHAGDAVYYIDACAGRGMDDAGNDGSPVLAAREAKIVEAQFKDQFHRDVRVHVVAIEKVAAHFRALEQNLAPFAPGAQALRGTLPEHLATLLAEMGADPALFFIDPFGIEPLKADVVYTALNRPHTEIFLLFADQAALRHYGVLTADNEGIDTAAGQMAFEISFSEAQIAQHQELRAARAAELEPTREACEAIMNDAFGNPDWRTRIDAAKPAERRQDILDLYSELLSDAGARYVLRIPIRNADNSHVYHLFHATRSPHGYVTMKEAVEGALNKAAVGGSVISTIRFLIRSDMAAVESRVRGNFAGQTVRWAEDENDKTAPSVRRFALQETPAFPSELVGLKQRLASLRVPGRGRTIVYRFPEVR
jgi:three-Cys-motif partner protein